MCKGVIKLTYVPSRRVKCLRRIVITSSPVRKKSFLCRDRMTTFEAMVSLGHWGWGRRKMLTARLSSFMRYIKVKGQQVDALLNL